MQSASFPARQTRTHYRHELRTLTYVILDEANGGVIRNLNHEGVAVQAVGPLRCGERVRLRFELRFPRLRVDACGRVSWANPSGQCGVRFVELSANTRYQINQWIFSNLLDTVAREAAHPQSIFADAVVPIVRQGHASEENDGLTLSATPRPAIRLEASFTRAEGIQTPMPRDVEDSDDLFESDAQLKWLSRPISARMLAWVVDTLVVTAALLLFAVIFLAIAHELPRWPVTLGAGVAAAAFVSAAYWGVFAVFGGLSLGARLAELTPGSEEKDEGDGGDRFR